MNAKGSTIEWAIFFIRIFGRPSGPLEELGFRCRSIFRTLSGVKSTVEMVTFDSVLLASVGVFPSSVVKTLAKYSLKILALSVQFVTSLFLASLIGGIGSLILSLLFMNL
jgi:hypothetical protein